MAVKVIFLKVIYTWILSEHWRFISGCQVKHINNELSEYRCVSENDGDANIWIMNLPQCVSKCLSMSTCRYINYNTATGQCGLGLGVCVSLVPAPGFLLKAFGPASNICLKWGSHDAPGRVPIQIYDGTEIIYASRVFRSNALIPGKYVTGGQRFYCSIEGVKTGPISLQDVDILTTDPVCTWSIVLYTSGDPIPSGAVIGGHLADSTKLYVVLVDNGSDRPSYGYYNPISGIAHYEFRGAKTTKTMHLLVLL